MTSPWRLLIIEDLEEDYVLLADTLRQQGFAAHTQRVETAAALQAALDRQDWDAVISDYNLPQFSAHAALPLVKAKDPDLPFVIVSGIVGEAAAVSAMRAGAHDFLSKDRLTLLGVSLAREIGDAQQRRARRTAEAERGRLSTDLDRALAEAELLNQIVITAAGQDDLGQMLTTALQALSRLIAFTGGSIALLEQNTLVIHAAFGPFAAQALGQRLPRRAGSRSWGVIETGQPFLSGDVLAQGGQPTTPIRAYLAVPLIWRGHAFGLLEVDSTTPDVFAPADLALTQKVAARLSGPIELAFRVAGERAAREAEQVASDRVRRLHRMGAALAGALLPEHVAQVAVDQGAGAIGATAGLLWRVDADPPLLEVVRALNVDEVGRQACEHLPLDLEAPAPEVGRTGQAIWLESATAQAARYPALVGTLCRPGAEALAYLPLAVTENVLGVMVFSFAQVHAFSPDEQAFLLALARQIAQALERARLFAAELAARQSAELGAMRVIRLQTLTAALSQAATPEEVMDTTLKQGAAALDTSAASINLITPDGQWLEVVRSIGYPADEIAQSMRRQPLTAQRPGPDVVRTGQALWLGTADDWHPRYADVLARREREQRPYPAAAILPLRVAGRVVGNVAFGFSSPRRFEEADRAFVTSIVDQCSQALERAQLFAAEQATARAARLLAEASAKLAGTPALETAAAAVSALVAPAFVDLCLVKLDGEVVAAPASLSAEAARLDELWQTVAAQVHQTGQPVLHSDVAAAGSAAYTVEDKALCAYLAVPLAARGQVLGVMIWATTAASDRWLEPHHLTLAAELGHRLALALDNSRLYADLEERVAERTTALNDTNASLQREISERRLAEVELEHSRDLLRDLSARLQAVREEERTRIAYRIHDDLGQQLAGLKMDLAWLTRQFATRAANKSVEGKLAGMSELIDSMVGTVRVITTDLRPGLLDDFGLPAALEWQVQEFQERTGVQAEFRGTPDLPLDSERATALFRIVQEALNNVAWHAQADRVIVELEQLNGHVLLTVLDNGHGISTGALNSPKSLGLLGMRERARRLGGDVDFKHRDGGGTQVQIHVPLKAA